MREGAEIVDQFSVVTIVVLFSGKTYLCKLSQGRKVGLTKQNMLNFLSF